MDLCVVILHVSFFPVVHKGSVQKEQSKEVLMRGITPDKASKLILNSPDGTACSMIGEWGQLFFPFDCILNNVLLAYFPSSCLPSFSHLLWSLDVLRFPFTVRQVSSLLLFTILSVLKSNSVSHRNDFLNAANLINNSCYSWLIFALTQTNKNTYSTCPASLFVLASTKQICAAAAARFQFYFSLGRKIGNISLFLGLADHKHRNYAANGRPYAFYG